MNHSLFYVIDPLEGGWNFFPQVEMIVGFELDQLLLLEMKGFSAKAAT